MYKGILHSHYLVVVLFLLIYVIKTILLLSNKNELLVKFSKKIKILEIIVSTLFLVSGIYLSTQLPLGGKYDYLFWVKIIMVFLAIPIAVIGFKKSSKILAASSLLLITVSFGISEVYSNRKGERKEIIKNELVQNDGKSLYESNCASCHGSNGKLCLAGAKDLTATLLDLSAINKIILEGRGLMSAVNVNREQANKIAEFVNGNIKGH